MRHVVIGAALAMMATTAAAQIAAGGPKDYEQAYSDCLAQSGGASNATVGLCAEGVAAEAEAEIKQLLQTAREMIDERSPEDVPKLDSAQASWLAYRNAQCELAGLYVGSPMYYVCPMKLNIARATELRELAGG